MRFTSNITGKSMRDVEESKEAVNAQRMTFRRARTVSEDEASF